MGLEPTTLRLTAECSAIELPRIVWSGERRQRRKASASILDFRVTVRAEQDALRGFSSEGRERPGSSSHGHRKALLLRIDVVKVQGSGAAVVTANRARPAGLGHKKFFPPPATRGDPLDRTAPTAPIPIGALDEVREPVVSAPPRRLDPIAIPGLSLAGPSDILNEHMFALPAPKQTR